MYPLVSKGVLCGLFGISRQAWYDNKKRQSGLQMQEVFILSLVKELRKEHKRMGAEKLHRLITPTLQEHNIKYGRDKFYFLLRGHGLLVKRRRRGPKQPIRTIFTANTQFDPGDRTAQSRALVG